MNLPDEIYVVVTQYDGSQGNANLIQIPLVWETYLDEYCSKSEAIERAKRLVNHYGEVKIGRLVFDLDDIDKAVNDMAATLTPEEKAQSMMEWFPSN